MNTRTALLVIDMQIGLVEGAYQEGLVLDRITIDAAFPAELIIRHHNAVLAGLAHPTHHITVRPSHEVTFGEGDAG